MAKKNMGKVKDLVGALKKDDQVHDGRRSFTKEEALKDKALERLMNTEVHSVKDDVIYIDEYIYGRPVTVMAVRIIRKESKREAKA